MKLFFKKDGAKLGQHFLTNRGIAEKIAKESGAGAGKTILEIGPGKGVLTQELLALGASVVAVEKDPEMVAILQKTFPQEIESGQLNVIEEDARTFLKNDYSNLIPNNYAVAANIPYYITGELTRLLLTAPHQPETIVLLVQKEVADRIARAKKESILSLSVKAYGTPRYIQTVKAGSFNPPPNVDSAVLKIEGVSRTHFTHVAENTFFDALHAGFGQKRKRLLGNLKRLYGEKVEKTWELLTLDSNIRAEDVPLTTWLQIATHL